MSIILTLVSVVLLISVVWVVSRPVDTSTSKESSPSIQSDIEILQVELSVLRDQVASFQQTHAFLQEERTEVKKSIRHMQHLLRQGAHIALDIAPPRTPDTSYIVVIAPHLGEHGYAHVISTRFESLRQVREVSQRLADSYGADLTRATLDAPLAMMEGLRYEMDIPPRHRPPSRRR